MLSLFFWVDNSWLMSECVAVPQSGAAAVVSPPVLLENIRVTATAAADFSIITDRFGDLEVRSL